jgi:quercetin dioxygenase-like cupin family protein
MRTLMTGLLCAAMIALPAAAADEAHNANVTVVFDQALPNVPGKSMRGVMVEYGPGGSNPSHMHPKSAFIYATVIEGSIKSQINDGAVKVYKTGENWSEVPGDHHRVSVVDTDETKLVYPDN